MALRILIADDHVIVRQGLKALLADAKMDAAVKVVPRAEYESFLAARKNAPPEQVGKEIFESVCLVCHKLDERYIGPALGGNPILGDPQALETTVRNGFRRMPAVGHDWTDEQMQALMAYTKQLTKGGQQGSGTGG